MAPPRSAVAQKLQKEQDDLLPSEDEDDSDFHLSGGEDDDGGSDSSDSEREGEQRGKKRAKLDDETPKEPVLDKNAVEDLWASFNDTADDPYAASTSTSTSASTPKPVVSNPTSSSVAPPSNAAKGKGKGKATLDLDDLVTIKVTYKFAGDTVTQDKKVPRNSQEAQNYFALHPSEKPSALSSTSTSSNPVKPDSNSSSLDALFGPESSSTTPAPNSNPETRLDSTTSTTSKSASPAPPPPVPAGRKKKAVGGLGAMAASLGVGGKPAKLNTLEKSKLDWNSYVQTQDGLGDTLTHARKDGYLEKKDFLDRVEMRKEEGWEKGRKKGGR